MRVISDSAVHGTLWCKLQFGITKHFILASLMLPIVCSCFRDSTFALNCEPAESLTVSPLYSNANDWTEYVINDGTNRYNATNSACTGAEVGGYDECLHGGEMRIATLTNVSSCDNITATDTLGAFNWVCDDSGGTVRIISDGFASSDKGLTTLIDFDFLTWKSNTLIVNKAGCTLGTSSNSGWGWTNTFSDLPAGINILSIPNNIYLGRNNITASYQYGVDHIAIIVEPGNVITAVPASGYSIDRSGGAKYYIWTEGEFNVNGEMRGIFYTSIYFSVLRNITIYNASTYNIDFYNSVNTYSENIESYGATGTGTALLINHGVDSIFKNIYTYNNTGTGVLLGNTGGGSTGNRLINIKSSNNVTGISICATCIDNMLYQTVTNNNSSNGISANINTVITGALSFNNSGRGIYLSGDNHTLIGATTTNNSGTAGLYVFTSTNSTVTQVASANNQTGLYLWDGITGDYEHLALGHNANDGLYICPGSNSNSFSESVLLGDNGTDCDINGTNDQIDNSCTPVNGGTASVSQGISLENSFVAEVSSDVTNTHSVLQLYDTLTDWMSFDNFHRAWGKSSGMTFPDATLLGHCITTEDCQLWDFSITASDSLIKEQIPCPNGNDTFTHNWDGGGSVTHLKRAVEVLGDHIGNDNVLCESGETCIFLPNIGGYQGHGSLVNSSCPDIESGGTITNVALVEYNINGR